MGCIACLSLILSTEEINDSNVYSLSANTRNRYPEDEGWSGSFVTYFLLLTLFVVVGYLVLHNKNKVRRREISAAQTDRETTREKRRTWRVFFAPCVSLRVFCLGVGLVDWRLQKKSSITRASNCWRKFEFRTLSTFIAVILAWKTLVTSVVFAYCSSLSLLCSSLSFSLSVRIFN